MATLKNRVGVATATTGTGTITLGTALAATTPINAASWRTFPSAGAVDGIDVRYLILDSNGAWEYGTGTPGSGGTTMIRTLGASSTGALLNLSGSSQVFITALAEDFRELLTAARTYYVGFVVGSPTISIATPAVVTLNSHGLVAGNQVAFSVLQNTTMATLSVASPCVCTITNSFAAGRPIVFSSTGKLPSGVVAGTTYYVIATGLSSSSFQFSATVGGAAINTINPTNTFVNGNTTVTTSANHNLVVGQIIQFSGTSVVNVANATNYYVLSTPAANTFTFAATGGGTAIVPGVVTTQGTFVQNGTHYNSTTGALPTGITEGTTYFVISTGLTTNAFQISTSLGGAAVNTSGTVTGTPVYSVRTGSDTNNGLTNSISGAWWTIQNAYNVICATLDQGSYTVAIDMADGTYTAGLAAYVAPCNGPVKFIGNAVTRDNVVIAATGGNQAFYIHVTNPNQIQIYSMKITTAGADAILADVAGANVGFSDINFGSVGGGQHIDARSGSTIYCQGNYAISGAAAQHIYCIGSGYVEFIAITVSLSGVPATNFIYCYARGYVSAYSVTYAGGTTGTRYNIGAQGIVNAFGNGPAYFPGTVAGTADAPTFALYL